jgi:acetyltransferase-like isoleucine patch superfamily enzyme
MLWDAFNYSPYQVNLNFALSFRRLIAKKLFKKCGKDFTALSEVTFYFPENIEVGDHVLFHNHTFIDAGGGVTFCDGATLAENSKIYTHEHDEQDMNIEIHKPVYVGKNAFILAGSTVLYGVTIGEAAIVGGSSMVNKDVPANTVVAGIPAKVVRERKAKLNDDYERDNFVGIGDN